MSILAIPLRVLRLRSTREDYLAFNNTHLAIGFVCTWLVGMGRHWDNPRVELPLSLGVGSLAYVFVLALLLFAIGLPFRNSDWTYRRVLTMVVLSSPPAAIYALPVERWMTFEEARLLNLWFLGLVALWRMLIWGKFVWLMCPAQAAGRIAVIFMPVTVIIISLVILNLEKAVVDFMAGLMPPPEGTTADEAYQWLIVVGILSIYFVLPIVGLTYIVSWITHLKKKRSVTPDS